MDRITVNLPDDLGARLRKSAAADFRSVSDYSCLLLRRAAELDSVALLAAAQELRALGLDPVIVLRDAIAEVERDQAMAPAPLKPAA